jgi:uncharacterized protein YjaZ
MDKLFTKKCNVDGKTLLLVALNSGATEYNFGDLAEIVEDEFTRLSHFIRETAQILYIRDNQALSIEGKYAGGHTYFPTETMIAVPSWQKLSRSDVVAVVAHELHHMARWQMIGYGSTLGGALASEGFATYYEEIRSGVKPKWAQREVSQEIRMQARQEWNSETYNHAQWFFDGPHGKWTGYSLGYELAKKKLPQFNLESTITLRSSELLEALNETGPH